MTSSPSVLFDLDDTLYRELDFVEEAMRNVAGFVGLRTGQNVDAVTHDLLGIMRSDGRGRVFDEFLDRQGLPAGWVAPMLYTYRRTVPNLQLYGDVVPLLAALREQDIHTGIVTDGKAIVQSAKIAALDLERLVDAVVLTDVIGPEAEKPNTAGFTVALELLQSRPDQSVYVANDLRKDFFGPRELGMPGILVARGVLGTLDDTPARGLPDHSVKDLREAQDVIERLDLGDV